MLEGPPELPQVTTVVHVVQYQYLPSFKVSMYELGLISVFIHAALIYKSVVVYWAKWPLSEFIINPANRTLISSGSCPE
jgi:hypothetical protein